MKVAICALSAFTYVAECIDLAVALSREHEVRYFLGYRDTVAIALLERRGVAYEVILDAAPHLVRPAAARSTRELFTGFFFAQANAVLKQLPARLTAWGAEVVLSHLRDYAGINAAAVAGLPAVSFGSHANPVRRESCDPPFGGGLSRSAPEAQRRLMWQYDREFHLELDAIYNRTCRLPYGLPPVQHVSTHASDRLILLSLIPALGNTSAPAPDHVRYVGSLFSKAHTVVSDEERALLEALARTPRPRVFVSLGTTYGSTLAPQCIEALSGFAGTVVASGSPAVRVDSRCIEAPFFADVDAVLRACDAVVTVCGGKTVMDVLAHGLPMVGLPRQGEQKEIAMALQEQGAALQPCLRKWDADAFVSAVETACADDGYRQAAARLQTEVVASGGAAQAVQEVLRATAAH